MIDRNTWRAALAFLFLCGGTTVATQEKAAAVGERLISMPPCRLLDTRVAAAKDAREESVRSVDVAADRCGKIVPAVATAYAIRVNVHDRTVGKVPPAARAAAPVRRFPAGAAIDFPVGAADHIAVDLEGYYVPKGAVTDPCPSSTSGVATEPDVAASKPATADARRPSEPRSDANPTGPYGDIFLDGSIFPNAGVLAVANGLKPWTIMNFDSQIFYHWPQYTKYHFRAYSPYEQKETFWVKAATSFDSITQTRADMYVSGYVGIVTTTPMTSLNVVGNNVGAMGSTAEFNSGVGAGSATSNQVNISNANAWGLILGFNGPGISAKESL